MPSTMYSVVVIPLAQNLGFTEILRAITFPYSCAHDTVIQIKSL